MALSFPLGSTIGPSVNHSVPVGTTLLPCGLSMTHKATPRLLYVYIGSIIMALGLLVFPILFCASLNFRRALDERAEYSRLRTTDSS